MFAAQHYASQLVLPASKRRSSIVPRSRKDTARRAFERVTKAILPTSYKELERVIAAEARCYDRAVAQLDTRRRGDTPDAGTVAEVAERCEDLQDDDVDDAALDAALDADECGD
ncbi:MAG: hypothetical protein LC777_14720 [Actinobacteria bacterium]|nr:hypothetical protein [Actinomycetota bacterium]